MYDPVHRPLPKVAVPSDRAWFDGRLITAACYTRVNSLTIQANVTTLIAKNDPSRVLLAICPPATPIANPFIGPWNDPQTFPFHVLVNSVPLVLTLFDRMTLVTGEWYANFGAVSALRIIEVRRK